MINVMQLYELGVGTFFSTKGQDVLYAVVGYTTDADCAPKKLNYRHMISSKYCEFDIENMNERQKRKKQFHVIDAEACIQLARSLILKQSVFIISNTHFTELESFEQEMREVTELLDFNNVPDRETVDGECEFLSTVERVEEFKRHQKTINTPIVIKT